MQGIDQAIIPIKGQSSLWTSTVHWVGRTGKTQGMKEEVVYQEWPTLRWNRSKTVCQDGLLIVWSPAVLAFPPRIRSISVTAQLSLVSTMAFYQFMMLRHLSNLPFQPVLLPFHVRSSTHAGASGCLFAAMQCSICCLASKVILLQDHVKKHVGYLNSLE